MSTGKWRGVRGGRISHNWEVRREGLIVGRGGGGELRGGGLGCGGVVKRDGVPVGLRLVGNVGLRGVVMGHGERYE